MTTGLYDLAVPTFLQTMRAMGGCLDKAAVHAAASGRSPDHFVAARLYPDMAALHFHVEAMWHHAVWGVRALRDGVFEPPALIGAMPFADLRAIVARGVAQLEAFDRHEIDACAARALDLTIGPRQLAFTAESYLLSFALPNFHFHAVTTYAVLRNLGVPLGKRDFEGVLRTAG